MAEKKVFRIVFHNQGKVYELHAREVGECRLMGFVEVAGLIFGERSAVLVDPAEERLKSEFQGVRRTYIPVHSILRIDEVEKEGANRIREVGAEDKVTHLPYGTPQPPDGRTSG